MRQIPHEPFLISKFLQTLEPNQTTTLDLTFPGFAISFLFPFNRLC